MNEGAALFLACGGGLRADGGGGSRLGNGGLRVVGGYGFLGCGDRGFVLGGDGFVLLLGGVTPPPNTPAIKAFPINSGQLIGNSVGLGLYLSLPSSLKILAREATSLMSDTKSPQSVIL